jgi:hypothetical protein
MSAALTIDKRAGHLVYGNIEDLRNSLNCGSDDLATLRRARQLAGDLREGATKCRMLDRAIAKFTASQPSTLSTPSPSPMPKSKPATVIARATMSHPELKATNQRLAVLKKMAVEHFASMRRIRGEESRHGLAAGLLLITIKESLPHGEFGKWAEENIEGFGKTYRAYLMQLALVFIEKMKVQRPELLAVRGDQIELGIEKHETLRARFEERVGKFIGEHSLAELFDKHGIKDAKKLGGARDKTPGVEPAAPATPEQLYTQSRDEIGGGIERLENLLLRENRMQFLVDHPEEIKGVVTGLRELADKVEAAAKPLLKPAKK